MLFELVSTEILSCTVCWTPTQILINSCFNLRILRLQTVSFNHGEGAEKRKEDQETAEGREEDTIATSFPTGQEREIGSRLSPHEFYWINVVEQFFFDNLTNIRVFWMFKSESKTKRPTGCTLANQACRSIYFTVGKSLIKCNHK